MSIDYFGIMDNVKNRRREDPKFHLSDPQKIIKKTADQSTNFSQEKGQCKKSIYHLCELFFDV
jgi:hypothetical protein